MSDYWERQARRYDRATLLLCSEFEAMARHVATHVLGLGEVLEVGAGTGLVTREAAQVAQSYVATDMSPAMLVLLRLRLQGQPNLQVEQADALDLAFEHDRFDAVVACNLLHLVPDPAACLFELRRVVKPGGVVVVPTFCHGEGAVARSVSAALGISGFPIRTRFSGSELDAVVGSVLAIEEVVWFQGLLPIRFVAARRPL